MVLCVAAVPRQAQGQGTSVATNSQVNTMQECSISLLAAGMPHLHLI